MSLRSKLDAVDEHIAQIDRLGLDGLANNAIGQSVVHQAGGFVRTRFVFKDDYVFVRRAPIFMTTDSPALAFRFFSPSPISIRAVSFRGIWQTVIGGPTVTLAYSFGSSASSVSDIVPAQNLSLISPPSDRATFEHYQTLNGVQVVSDVYFNLRVNPITGILNEATISRGSSFDIIWNNLNA